jgi:hypothetical protein
MQPAWVQSGISMPVPVVNARANWRATELSVVRRAEGVGQPVGPGLRERFLKEPQETDATH